MEIQVPGVSNLTENWDGTSWTVSSTLATAREDGAAANQGTSSSTAVFGGFGPATTKNTEEYNFTTNTITAAAWASGGALGTYKLYGSKRTTRTSRLQLYILVDILLRFSLIMVHKHMMVLRGQQEEI